MLDPGMFKYRQNTVTYLNLYFDFLFKYCNTNGEHHSNWPKVNEVFFVKKFVTDVIVLSLSTSLIELTPV